MSEYAPDIVAFIEARHTEIEAHCANTTQGDWKSWAMSLRADQDGTSNVDTAIPVADFYSPPQFDRLRTWNMTHAQYWQPRRALALVAAQRRIVERYQDLSKRVGKGGPDSSPTEIAMMVALGEVLIDLASLWREHPDWDESWEVENGRE